MKRVDEKCKEIEDLVGTGATTMETSETLLHMYDIKDGVAEEVHEYKETINSLLSMIKNGYDPHSFYDTDILNDARELGTYK